MCFRPPVVDAGPIKCPNCGKEIPGDATECPFCGAKEDVKKPSIPTAPSMPSAPKIPSVPKAPGTPK